MPKNIVICCDATGNAFGAQVSNVLKLYKSLVSNHAQITYYHPGLGTVGTRNALTGIATWWNKTIGLAFGYGISENIVDAYEFLIRNFEQEDRLYCFGFGRGAYTVRALCGLLHVLGLLTEGNQAVIPYAMRIIKGKLIDFSVAFDFKLTFSRNCKPYFLGVWDTVSPVGWVFNATRFPFTRATSNPDLAIVRHALAIDERRAFFRPIFFGRPSNPQQDVKEVWFAGVHADVGGSYPEHESQLSQIALRWMMNEAERAGLLVDSQKRWEILGGRPPNAAPDPNTGYQHESLRGLWWIAELWPRTAHVEVASGLWRKVLGLNLGRRRFIPPGSLIHESVVQRLLNPHYRPSNLPLEYNTTMEGAEELRLRRAH